MKILETFEKIPLYKVLWYSIAVSDCILALLYICAYAFNLYDLNTFWVGIGFTILLMLSLIFLFLLAARHWDESKGKIKEYIELAKWIFVVVWLLDWVVYIVTVYFAFSEMPLTAIMPELIVLCVWMSEIAFLEGVIISFGEGDKKDSQNIVFWLFCIFIIVMLYNNSSMLNGR